MELKNYLHYYLGCKCFTYSGNGILQSFDIKSGRWYVGLDSGGGTVGNINDIYTEYPEESKKAFPKVYPPKSILKPKLRRLEDMTEDEAIAIARLCFFDRDKGYPDSDFKARKVGIASEKPSTYEVRIDNDWYDEAIKIGFITGNIWRCNGSTEHLHNQSQVFHYRLQCGFDLFGLIDAGLAIDAKTTKEQ